MFDLEFFPTPSEVVETMLQGVPINGKSVLEPSAGKGDIVDMLNKMGAKQILTYEKNKDLATIVSGKSKFMGNDFFECRSEDVSHLDLIIMNPPFSNADKHILHAWEIAPEGCTLVSLCNWETVNNDYSSRRKQISVLIREKGVPAVNLGKVFDTAERKTGIDIGLIRLTKPLISEGADFEGFYLDEDKDENPEGAEGLMPYNEVRDVVMRYVGALKAFDRFEQTAQELKSIVTPLGRNPEIGIRIGYQDSSTLNKEDFAKDLQKTSWHWVINKMKIDKFVTTGVKDDINKFVEQQTKYPFTMKNIYQMMDMIIQTRGQTMNRAIIEVFDNITMHHDKNRHNVEGWKTNKNYIVGKKFILEGVTDYNQKWPNPVLRFKYDSYGVRKMNDLNKALGYLTGINNEIRDLYQFKHEVPEYKGVDFEYNEWLDWGFFEIKGFMKGTIHVKFKDENVWATFNRKVAEIKGFPLPEKLF